MKLTAVNELFDINRGTGLDLNALEGDVNGIPFVSRTASNNGVLARVTPVNGLAPINGGVLSVALVGNAMATFYQDEPFYTAQNVVVLTPKVLMTRAQLLFYALCLGANKYRFSYGRAANRTIGSLLIPARSELPPWAVEIYDSPGTLWHDLNTAGFNLQPVVPAALGTSDWKQFRYDELFDIRKGKRLTNADMIVGSTIFIGATEYGNGETARIGQEAMHPGGQISVSYNGSVAEAFYQPLPFWASDDVNVFYPRFELSLAVAMFFVTMIRREKYRYNYGRKWKLDGMKSSTLPLPATAEGFPDFEAMEALVQNLPSWKLLERLR